MKWPIIFLLAISCFAQEVKRPTKDTDVQNAGCRGTRIPSPAMPKAHDAAGLTTWNDLVGAGTNQSDAYSARNFSGWTAPGFTYVGLTLNINTQSLGYNANGDGSGGGACVDYSLNNGNSFTKIRCDSDFGGSGWGQITDTIPLSVAQDLTQVQIEICAWGTKGLPRVGIPPGSDDVQVFDIWTLGLGNPQGGGNGSGNGEPSRDIVIPN